MKQEENFLPWGQRNLGLNLNITQTQPSKLMLKQAESVHIEYLQVDVKKNTKNLDSFGKLKMTALNIKCGFTNCLAVPLL